MRVIINSDEYKVLRAIFESGYTHADIKLSPLNHKDYTESFDFKFWHVEGKKIGEKKCQQ